MAIVKTSKENSRSYPFIDTRRLTKAFLQIDGKEIQFRELSVEQPYGEHHSFTVDVPFNILKKELFMNKISEIFELVGKKVLITFQKGDDIKDDYAFKGIVTHVELNSVDGTDGFILIRGKSRTVLLDSGKRYAVYSGWTLKGILAQIERGYLYLEQNLSIVHDFEDTPSLDIAIQYNESDWEFIKRLCYEYGINMYFTGSQLFIGNPEEWKRQSYVNGADISRLSFGTRLIPNQYKYIGYDPLTDYQMEKETGQSQSFRNKYLDFAADTNKKFASKYIAQQPFTTLNAGYADGGERIEIEESRIAGKTVYVSGESKSYWTTIGRPIQIISDESSLGTFRVTKSKHIIDSNHVYRNEFEGIPASLKYIPIDEPERPVANSLRGIVTSTDDPDNKGRVQVEFPLLEDVSRAWLRVMTLDAGLTEDKEVNRGLIFVPEKGTQVIVGFEMGNPNFPYIAGALFHGKNREGGKENNYIKSLRTTSGHTLEFNDGKDGWGIALYDKNKNLLHINSKDNKIEVSAVEEIILNSKKITINATEELNLIGSKIAEHGKEHEILTEGTYKVEANEQKLKSNNYTQSSTSNTEIISGNNVDIKGSAINLDMGGSAQSPKAPAEARNMIAFTPAPQSILESEILPEETNVEEQGKNPQIVSIKLFDNSGQETEFLSRSTNVEVETKDMAGRTIELKLKDKETNEDVHLGDFFIPTNDYILKTSVKKKEHHVAKSKKRYN
ncbi:type VI secretion system Vgr family protein [Dysgonomonas sp. 25]|uniref:type VI secretion system Vgr family protein n=1 Tax=Dysgonomonas sp. 25 TaxID=2302933 RepID=UPI0013D4FE4A|nr:phage baseplate assembly protein V [Dysgonomonas sp. 25]NDV68620.1 hypothetical protein [Dysgonomonas sp. 25]